MSRMPASDCCSDSRLSVVATCACSLQRRSAGRTLRWTASVATVRSPPATSVTAGSTSSSAVMSPMATIASVASSASGRVAVSWSLSVDTNVSRTMSDDRRWVCCT